MRNFGAKRISQMARPGHPRANLEEKILADMAEHEKQLEAIVAEKIDFNRPSILTFEAACLVLRIERGADPQAVRGTAIFRTINQYAQAHGPHGRWRGARDFLEEFIQHYAPKWKWREQIDDGNVRVKQFAAAGQPDARRVCLSWQCTEKLRRIIPTDPAGWATLPGKIYYGGSRSRNERIAKERASMKRHDEARVNRFVTADEPDAGMLHDLRQRIIPTDPTTWPTLRELNLATAMPERTIKTIVANLRPKPRQAEIVKIPLRHKFSKCGAMPRRYGPRLVIGVLNEFVNRLPEFQIGNEERRRLQKTAMRIKRAFVARLTHSRSST
jgi:hypothetical protein